MVNPNDTCDDPRGRIGQWLPRAGFSVMPWAPLPTMVLVCAGLWGCQPDNARLTEVEKRLADVEKRLADVEQESAAPETPESEASEDVFTRRLKELEQRIAKSTPSPAQPAVKPAPGKSAQTPAKPEPPADPEKAPRIHVEQPEFDFGTTWVGAKLKHAFTVKNVGKTTLDIIKVRPTCGCTAAGPYPDKLEPGETGKLAFTLDTKRLRGSYSKKIRVETNDPTVPVQLLTIKGVNKFYVEATPSTAMFGTVYGDEPIEKRIRIKNNTEDSLTLKIAGEKPEGVFAFDLQEKEPGKEYELKVTTKPPHKSGSLNAVLTLETNIEDQPAIDVRAFARVAERLDVFPKLISLTKRGDSDLLIGHARFMNNGEKPVKVLEATVDDPNITARLTESSPGKAYVVMLEGPVSAEIPASGRTLTLKTDDPETPAITVPIRNAFARLKQSQTNAQQKRRPVYDTVGKPAPTLSAKTAKGKAVSNLEFTGVPATVLNFIAPNCGFCKKQIPKVENVRAEFEKKGIRFVNVRETMRRPYTVEQANEVLEQLGSNLEVIHDPENKIGRSFKAISYPTMVIVGNDGVVKHVNVGAKPDLEETLRRQLSAMVKDTASAAKPSS